MALSSARHGLVEMRASDYQGANENCTVYHLDGVPALGEEHGLDDLAASPATALLYLRFAARSGRAIVQ